MAARRRKGVMIDLFTIPPADIRYWSGTEWITSRDKAKVYSKTDDAIADGETIKIWDKIPDEWIT
jgi:hypothetical protein